MPGTALGARDTAEDKTNTHALLDLNSKAEVDDK